jgi:hypothetical protein
LIVTTINSKSVAFAKDESPGPSAQLTANEDNLHTAFAHLKSTLLNAKITNEVQALIKNVYPPHIPFIPPTPCPHNTCFTNLPTLQKPNEVPLVDPFLI